MATSSKATSMAELLAAHKTQFVSLQKGQAITGTITKISPQEILLDVGAKTEAVVMEKDRKILKHLLHLLKAGDTVEATVLSPESEEGYPVVSLRRFAENATWKLLEELLKSGDKIDTTVSESTKGGFVVDAENGISGFMPNSHVDPTEDTDELVGKTVKASIVDLNREQKKVIFSQKGVLTEENFKKAVANLKPGTKVTGIISGITTFGMFVNIPVPDASAPLEALIHISEVSWEKVEDLGSRYSIGQHVEAVVIGADSDAKRVDLSIKKLTADPFEEIAKAFPVDKKVTGTIAAIDENGVTMDLGKVGEISVEGMIRKEKIPPTTKYEIGQQVQATVIQVDARKRKVLLTPVLKEKPLMYR